TNENFILISNKYSAKVTTGNTTKVNNGNAIMNDEANGSLIINKTDIKGQPIKDVIFDIYEANADGSANLDKYVDSVQTDEEGKATWTSNEGNYVAIEKVAPESYVNEEQAQNFSLKRKEVALLDYMNKIKYDEVLVKKRDVGDKELAGATLCIMSNDKSPLQIKEKNEFKDTTYDKGVMCWQSETKDKEFSVPIGEYTMYEEMAPQGYEKTSQTFPFSVVGNGEVHDIKIVNQPIKYDDIHVSKVDLNDNELVGATLCIMTKDNSPLEIKEKNDNSTKIFEDGKMCWLSSNHPKEFKLRMGNYYLYEQVAPFGYQKTSQLFNFNVIGKNKVQKFKIINSPIKLPRTGK
ncbi:MAG: hypothetical protein LBR40_05780, partial [Bacilli bacterium]|nr:hypothetical protein [Bacilli bacterium]